MTRAYKMHLSRTVKPFQHQKLQRSGAACLLQLPGNSSCFQNTGLQTVLPLLLTGLGLLDFPPPVLLKKKIIIRSSTISQLTFPSKVLNNVKMLLSYLMLSNEVCERNTILSLSTAFH